MSANIPGLNIESPYYDKVRALRPEARFARYVRERYKVRSRRLAGEHPDKWTDDMILRSFKFTNVKRDWDYTSTWLKKRWYAPNYGHELIGLMCAVARFVCLVPSLQAIGIPGAAQRKVNTRAKLYLEKVEKTMLARQDAGHKVFTSAYVIGGVAAGHKKASWVVWEYLWPAFEAGLLTRKWETLDEAHEALNQLNGWGHFMTQEVVLDFVHTWYGSGVTDRESYAYAGPGAIRGLNRVFDLPYDGSMPQSKARDAMRVLHTYCTDGQLRRLLPPELHLTLHDIEFNLCEFDKYERVLFGDGTPKQKFHGPAEAQWLDLTTPIR